MEEHRHEAGLEDWADDSLTTSLLVLFDHMELLQLAGQHHTSLQQQFPRYLAG